MFKYCSNNKTARFYATVDDIPEVIWQSLDCEKNLYLHRNFLKSIEKNHRNLCVKYIVLFDDNDSPKAIASVQIIDFYLDAIKNDFELFIKKLRKIASKLHIFPDKKALQLLICGNTFVSGEHGIFIKKGCDKKLIIKEIAKSILHLAEKDKSLKIDAFLLKDFINESLFITDELKYYNYHPFSVEPNMVLKLDENWGSFDDYLAALKTKFRVKAKKAFELSSEIKIEDVTLENIDAHLPKMTALYKKVASKADFNLSDFNLDTYLDLKQNFGENYILKIYSIEDKTVGFLSGMITNNSLDAHFVGIDYSLNKKYAIYQRMLYNYIEIAISKGLEAINYGRTASEIKSSVGAEPQALTMYLRHKKSLTNRILKLFLQRIQPTPFHQNFPFKNEKK